MDDEPKVEQLENRIDSLESTIEKMMPSRRDALKMGGAAMVGGAAMSGTASAGTNQVGTIGSQASPVDLESEDINNADTVTTDTLDSTTQNNSGTLTTQDLVVNGTATGPFGGGGIVFEDGDPITERNGQAFAAADTFFDVFNLSTAVDVYGGAIYGGNISKLRITFASNNTVTLDVARPVFGEDIDGTPYGVQGIFPMSGVKRLESFNDRSVSANVGFQVYTT